jgi:lipopolysaccharide/colanic/teichoic acid biosynthesis glycosyltransferase
MFIALEENNKPVTDKVILKQISGTDIVLKRTVDIIISLLALPFALPLIFVGGLLMAITTKGPIIFTQKRVGLLGKPFTIFKLRTMVHCKEGYLNHTTENDSRITKIGNLLRKTKIDELPQLFNVLSGEMSIIGPRPERVDIVEKINQQHKHYQLRHLVKPGITGWAQVNKPTATPEQNLEKLEYDLYYINNYSIKLDVKILAKTVGVVKKLESL